MPYFVIEHSDGRVSIMNCVDGEFESVEKEIDKWPPEHKAMVVGYHPLEGSIPGDRTFRDAWKTDKGKLNVDMDRAREGWRNEIRKVRAPLLAALDIEYFKAMEASDEAKKTEIASKKQLLRGIPQDKQIDDAKTPDELKAFWPPELGEPPTPKPPSEPDGGKDKPKEEKPT